MSDANKELVRRHFAQIWNDRNLDACDELMAARYRENAKAPFGSTAPGELHGPTAMRQTVAWLTTQFPDIRMEIDSLIGEGDLVAARVTSTGTNLGPIAPGMPATGKSFTTSQTHWFRVADGQLCEHWATRDDLTAMIQLGVVAPPGPPA